jgi:signal transduction histidine kinase
VILEVEDDGELRCRCDRPANRATQGLPGIRERASLFGGTLQVTSAPSMGTRIEVSIPVQPEVSDGDAD